LAAQSCNVAVIVEHVDILVAVEGATTTLPWWLCHYRSTTAYSSSENMAPYLTVRHQADLVL